jgi:outer membrane protein assembly factor BamB
VREAVPQLGDLSQDFDFSQPPRAPLILPESTVLVISRTSGPPGSSVGFSGVGFTPGEQVNLTFDTVPVGSVTADAKGSVSGTVTVPTNAADRLWELSARGTGSNNVRSATFYVQTPWPQLGGAQTHVATNPYELTLAPSNVLGLRAMWSTAPLGPTRTPPITADGLLVATGANGITAYDPVSGAQQWTLSSLGSFGSGPGATANGLISAYDTSGTLRTISASTQKQKWQIAGAGVGCSCGLALANGSLFGIDPATGRVRSVTSNGAQAWSTDVQSGNLIEGAPALSASGAAVYTMGNAQSTLYALNASTGATLWSAALPGGDHTDGSPVITPTSVLIEGATGQLYGFDPSTGAPQTVFANASLPSGGSLLSSPAFAQGVIVLAGRTAIEAVNPTTGAVLWQDPMPADAQGQGYPSVAIANGVAYATAGSALLAFNLNTGAQLVDLQNPTGGAFLGPVLANGMVYVADAGTGVATAYGLPPS